MKDPVALRVLRDVAVLGRRAVGRTDRSHGAAGGSFERVESARGVSPVQAGNLALHSSVNSATAVLQPVARSASAVTAQGRPESPESAALAVAHAAAEEAYRRGFEAGVEQGRVAAAAEATRSAMNAAEREIELRVNRLREDLARQMREAGEQQFRERTRALDALLEMLPTRIDARVAAVEDELAATCFEVVSRILGEVAPRPEAVQAQVARATARLRGRQANAIRLHPDDLAALQKTGAIPSDAAQSAVRWIADPGIGLGGCLIESADGGLDARIETQLAILREALAGTRADLRAATQVDASRGAAP
jgi:flagellar assembly protein FliH